MKRAFLVLVLLVLLAAPAVAEHGARITKSGYANGNWISYDPAATSYCPLGETWHIKVHAEFYEFTDDYGSALFELYSSGVRYSASYTYYWDGLTKTWDSNRRGTTLARMRMVNTASTGLLTVTFYCT